MRIKTTRTLRAIDSWKNRVILAHHRYIGVLSILITALGFAKPSNVIVSLFIVGASLNFAFLEFGLLVLVGLLIVKLQFYRFANLFLRFGIGA